MEPIAEDLAHLNLVSVGALRLLGFLGKTSLQSHPFGFHLFRWHPFIKIYEVNFVYSGGFWQHKIDIKRPFEIRIVTK